MDWSPGWFLFVFDTYIVIVVVVLDYLETWMYMRQNSSGDGSVRYCSTTIIVIVVVVHPILVIDVLIIADLLAMMVRIVWLQFGMFQPKCNILDRDSQGTEFQCRVDCGICPPICCCFHHRRKRRRQRRRGEDGCPRCYCWCCWRCFSPAILLSLNVYFSIIVVKWYQSTVDKWWG